MLPTAPQAINAAARFFQRSGATGELSAEEEDGLAALGIDAERSPAAAAALARLFKRPGGFATAPEDERRTALAACRVDPSDQQQLAALARLFRRPGGFGELPDEEAAALAAAGIDVHEPASARALARLFKRPGGLSDLSDEEKDRLALAGVDMENARTMRAVDRLFKRPGGFADPSLDDGETGALPSPASAPAAAGADDASGAAKARLFKRGDVPGADAGASTLFTADELPEMNAYEKGSARIALELDSSFDEYIFVDKKQDHTLQLQDMIHTEYPGQESRCQVLQGDGPAAIREICVSRNWRKQRAVLFLDPYGMNVEWDLLRLIADTEYSRRPCHSFVSENCH